MRMSGRGPPYLLGVLTLFAFVSIYGYWDLYGKKSDLQTEVDRLQGDVKLSLSKQHQLEKKNGALQEAVQDLDRVVAQLKKQGKVDQEEQKTMRSEKETLNLEINKYKKDINNFEVQVRSLNREIDKLKEEIAAAQKKTNDHYKQIENINRVVEDKDVQLVNLKHQLAQATELHKLQDNIRPAEGSIIRPIEHVPNRPLEAVDRGRSLEAAQKAHPSSYKQEAKLRPGDLGHVNRGAVHIQDIGMKGMSMHNQPILPRVHPDALRAKPRFSVADLEHGGAVDLAPNPSIDSPNNMPKMDEKPVPNPASNVLPLPPHQNKENLDNAIDEIRRGNEEQMSDQDEEGKDINEGTRQRHLIRETNIESNVLPDRGEDLDQMDYDEPRKRENK